MWVNGKRVYVKQHRWIVEQAIGRRLLRSEDVHHKNGIRDDNRLENLQVIGHGKHAAITGKTRDPKRGHKLNLTTEERQRRSERAKAMYRAGKLGSPAQRKQNAP